MSDIDLISCDLDHYRDICNNNHKDLRQCQELVLGLKAQLYAQKNMSNQATIEALIASLSERIEGLVDYLSIETDGIPY